MYGVFKCDIGIGTSSSFTIQVMAAAIQTHISAHMEAASQTSTAATPWIAFGQYILTVPQATLTVQRRTAAQSHFRVPISLARL